MYLWMTEKTLMWLTALLVVSLYLLSLAYYRFKAKGFMAGKLLGLIAVLVIALVFANWIIGIVAPMVGIGICAALLLCSIIIKPMPNAPGFNIRFRCPECRHVVEIPRSKEGLADYCPSCGEIIRVPREKDAAK